MKKILLGITTALLLTFGVSSNVDAVDPLNWELPQSELEKAGKFVTAQGLPAQIISALLTVIFPIAGFITAIMIVISGIQFVTSKGDPKAAEAAKGRLTYAIIGFIVILLSFAILQTINFLFLKSGIT